MKANDLKPGDILISTSFMTGFWIGQKLQITDIDGDMISLGKVGSFEKGIGGAYLTYKKQVHRSYNYVNIIGEIETIEQEDN